MIVCFVLCVGQFVRVCRVVLVFRRQGRLERDVVDRLRRLVGVVVLFQDGVRVATVFAVSDAYRVVATIPSAFCFDRFAGRDAGLRLAFEARAPIKCLVRVVDSLRLRIVTCVLVFLGAARRFIGIVIVDNIGRVPRRTGRAVDALYGRVSFLTYLRCEGLYHEGRAAYGGTRAVFLVLLSLEGSFASDFLCRLSGPGGGRRVTCVGDDVGDERFGECNGDQVYYSRCVFCGP